MLRASSRSTGPPWASNASPPNSAPTPASTSTCPHPHPAPESNRPCGKSWRRRFPLFPRLLFVLDGTSRRHHPVQAPNAATRQSELAVFLRDVPVHAAAMTDLPQHGRPYSSGTPAPTPTTTSTGCTPGTPARPRPREPSPGLQARPRQATAPRSQTDWQQRVSLSRPLCRCGVSGRRQVWGSRGTSRCPVPPCRQR